MLVLGLRADNESPFEPQETLAYRRSIYGIYGQTLLQQCLAVRDISSKTQLSRYDKAFNQLERTCFNPQYPPRCRMP